MTFKFKNVYLNETATVVGPYENKGPLSKYFDKSYDNLYANEKTFELAETKMLNDSVNILLNKMNKNSADVFLSGDLLNQIIPSNLTALEQKIPFLGLYNACATSMEGIIIGSTLIDSEKVSSVICATSSHNCSAEKQFRYPNEYGGSKPKIATFTSTGGASAYLSNTPSNIKVEAGTIGTVVDLGITDVFNMGAVMAPAAASTIEEHLRTLKRKADYYDLIVTGDLGIYGKQILMDYIKETFNIELTKYNDCGVMLYKLKDQSVYAGGSGPVCCPLVTYSVILDRMKRGELKKVLICSTGALHSPTLVNQKLSIPAICHAISLEVVK
ncbi:MAG: stage V sporulation protein AD [Bacilli bacterium]|nr:stage V sporulation protein AD [Bacilli bacterium]